MVELMPEETGLPDPDSKEDRRLRTQIALGGRGTDTVDRDKISGDRAAALRDSIPDDPVALPAGMLACAFCGQAAKAPKSPGAVIKIPVYRAKPEGRIGAEIERIALVRCSDCVRRRLLALRLAADHPSTTYALGGRAVDAIESALAVLAILGRPLPDPSISDVELASMLRTMSLAARGALWQSQPVSGRCSPRPWGVLREDVRSRLRRAFLDHQAEMVKARRPPVPVPPPPVPAGPGVPVEGGCLLCGVGAVEVNALKVHRGTAHPWQFHGSMSQSALGGPDSRPVAGHLCAGCADAVRVHGMGRTAVETSFAAAIEGRDPGLAGLVRAGETQIRCWAGMVLHSRAAGQPSPPPNSVHWEHVETRLPPVPEPPYDPDDVDDQLRMQET